MIPATLPPQYRALLDRVVAVLEPDPRVRAVWVHGSHARGDGDELSDLDVMVAVADESVVEFGDDWRDRVDAIAPTLMARRFPGPTGSFISMTRECLRLDMWVETAGTTPTSVVKDRTVVFDRDGLDPLVPPPDRPAPASQEKLASLRDWAGACLAVLPGADPLLTIEIVHTLRWILYEAYVETNRPMPKTGLKQWSAKLTTEQRATLECLPTGPDVQPVITALEAVLGPLEPTTPDLARAVFPPEGFIRALVLNTVPPAERLRHVAEELFAFHLYLTVVLHRRDWLLGVEGVHALRKMLYELDVDTNGRTPAAVPADWSGRLTAEQREELLALPTGEATREGVIEGHRAVREAFVRRGRAVLGASWPAEMEEAVVTHVERFIPGTR